MERPDQSAVSVVALEIAPGKEDQFLTLAGQLQALILRKGYGIDQLLRDGADARRYYEICTWKSARAAHEGQADPEVQALWQTLEQTLKVTQLVDVAWAVEVGLVAAGPWQERRAVSDRRARSDRRAGNTGRPEGERRTSFDRRIGPRRTDAHGQPNIVVAARHARELAQATFSGFKVGAALETDHGIIVTGCNIENVTYGLTISAERVAMFKAVSDGHRAFRRIAVVADTLDPTPPCGACRQILWEFGGDLEVILADLYDVKGRHRLGELLPLPFDARLLK